MALRIFETWSSGSGSLGRSAGDVYSAIVTGTAADNADDPTTAVLFAIQYFAVVSSAGNTLADFHRERIAPFAWLFTAVYESPTGESRQTNDATFSFTTGGGTQHITHAIKTVQRYGILGGDPIPDPQGAIGATVDSVDGVDIHVSTFDFKTTFYVPVSMMSNTYMSNLFSTSNHVNSDTVTFNIRGLQISFKPGELLFLNGDGSERKGFGDYEITLNWSAQPNKQNFMIGDIPVESKDGWDYLWVKYSPDVDSSGNFLIQKPIAVYIDQVYERGPLSILVFGSDFGITNHQPWLVYEGAAGGGFNG